LISEGHEFRGLYYLGTKPTMSCLASPKLLHDHLGHPHLSKLKTMIPEFCKLPSLRVWVMSIRKTYSVFFSKKLNQGATLFSIIHFDIWGPSSVSSFGATPLFCNFYW